MITRRAAFELGYVVNWYFGAQIAFSNFHQRFPSDNDVAIVVLKHPLEDNKTRIRITVKTRHDDNLDTWYSLDTVHSEIADLYISECRVFLKDARRGIPLIDITQEATIE